MKNRIFFILLLFLFHSAFSDGLKYPVSQIPQELFLNADIVVRLNETKYEVKSLTHLIYKVHLVYTILHENAFRAAWLRVYYDNDSRVNSIHGIVFNAEGVKIKSYSGSDIQDVSAVSGDNFYSDDRCKVIIPQSSTFPFTVEYEYEVTQNNIMYFASWQPQNDYHWSVESSSFEVTFPRAMNIRYKEVNTPVTLNSNSNGDEADYVWSLKNLPAQEEDPLNPGFRDVFPTIFLAPLSFSYSGYSGDMSTWNGLGEFQSHLNKGRNKLPDKTIKQLTELVKDKPDNLTKIEAIYKFMQSRTRYTSIQIGLGGWQPSEAFFIDEKGYGDCKALVNYMKALLDAVNIPSFYTLITAGKNPKSLMKDFPSLQFNHVILCVPNKGDTIWLECTNQNIPFGYLGSFTDDRFALLINENNSKLIHTPVYSIHDNLLNRTAIVQIDEDGNAGAEVVTTYKGLQFETIWPLLNSSFEEQKKVLEENLGIPGCSVKEVRYKIDKNPIPVAIETLKLTIRSYATKSGDHYFLPLDILNIQNFIPKNAEERKADFILRHEYSDYDSITYYLPSSIKIESLPSEKSLESETGKYKSVTRGTKNELVFIRKREYYSGTFTSEKAKPYVEFMRQIAKADREKAVLKIIP